MRLLLIGLSHRTAPVELREKLVEDQSLPAQLTTLIPSVQECVLLSTCNRFEIYCVGAGEDAIVRFLCQHYNLDEATLRAHLYIYQEREATLHLMQVTCGLDSMILGEPQILGQVATARDKAQKIGADGPLLHRLFTDAVHAGKRARTETVISQYTMSISHAAALLVKQQTAVDVKTARVMVLGAGEMAEQALDALVHHGFQNIAILNRTYERAQALAARYNIGVQPWGCLWELLPEADIVFSATGAPHLLMEARDMRRVARDGLVIVDIAVPRDIDSAVSEFATYYDIDDLKQVVDDNLAHRQACVPAVERIACEQLEHFWSWLAGRRVVPVIKDLRQKVQHDVEIELADALSRLEHLPEADRAVIQRLAHRITNKFLHTPTTNLRENAIRDDVESYAQIVRELFALVGARHG